jgi:hypothetical protein
VQAGIEVKGKTVKQHLFIILTIVIGFSTFMLGYSLPPFLEVGFGDGGTPSIDSGAGDEAELMKQFEDLYKELEE